LVKQAAAMTVNSSPANGSPVVLPLSAGMTAASTPTRNAIISITLRSTDLEYIRSSLPITAPSGVDGRIGSRSRRACAARPPPRADIVSLK